MNTEKFIEKAKEKHGNKYNYSLVIYKSTNDKIKIICNTCENQFEQGVWGHLRSVGGGCSLCNNHRGNGFKYTNEEFINKAKIIHGERYNYDLINYKNTNTHIEIQCSKHGIFKQIPYIHLLGSGCQKCQSEFMRDKNLSNSDEFIKKAELLHGDLYDYKLIDYKIATSKVKIICSKHDIFQQTPQHHLEGQGCPKCNTLGNVSEPKLFNRIKEAFPKEDIISQGKPLWLRSKTKPQSLDIYFLDHNIGIEYQGGQHFRSIKWFGGNKTFNNIQNLDKRKRLKCLENNCKLLYFTYKSSDVPKDYPFKVFTNEEELINEIKKYII